MASNYFGFTHGSTQYGAQPASAYPAAAQTAYVQPTPQTAYAAAPRAAQTYETYQAPTTGQYAYATRTQTTPTYDASKTYYAPAAAAPAAATAVYTVAETAYQAAAKPAYSTTSYTTTTQPRQTATSKTPTPSQTPTSYSYSTPNTTTGGNNSSYDAALYSAATTYYHQQQAAKTGSPSWSAKKTYAQKPKQKAIPKQPQLHYCEVCKISCAGPQTYREHLEGQKHKKKEAAAKTGGAAPPGRGHTQLRCELCDVSCTGADAYAAHIRGAKHQKVLKLHTKLGKHIPSTDPVVVGNSSTAATTTSNSTGRTTASTTVKTVLTKAPATTVPAVTVPVTKKVLSTPKITFVGGTQLKATGIKSEEIKTAVVPVIKAEPVAPTTEDKSDSSELNIPGEKDVQPVGLEYIDEISNEFGNVVQFHCKLCECKFNDPNAKMMHTKGRRHRLQYKKKVDPSLQVEIKPSIRARKLQEEKMRRQAAKEEYWRRRDMEERWRMEWEQRRYEEEFYNWQRGGPGGWGMGHPPFGGPHPSAMDKRKPHTSDDRHVMAKHASIYPNEVELQAVQNIVSSCEKALKLVSDYIAESDAPKPMDEGKKEIKKEKEEEKKEAPKEGETKEEASTQIRAMKGVMRVGVLAKGLLLHGDLNVHLVVLCSEKPTRTLLERIVDNLPKQLSTVGDEEFEVKMCVEEAGAIVTSQKEVKATCTITLTSPIMRDENLSDGEKETVQNKPDPPDVLDRQKCLQALAALRHAKWFQARANGLQSCVVVIRILRDLCHRVPTWTPLNQWALELLVEKCVSSGGANMSPGDALRRVFECIASGLLLPGGPDLYDPCEKEAAGAAATLSNQEREDITASAQHALRLIAFRQIHKVLGMDALPQPKFMQGKRLNNPRKRRRTNSTGDGTEAEGGEGKKDKKDGDGDDIMADEKQL